MSGDRGWKRLAFQGLFENLDVHIAQPLDLRLGQAPSINFCSISEISVGLTSLIRSAKRFF